MVPTVPVSLPADSLDALARPNAIQPHGALVAFDPALEHTIQASANLPELLGTDWASVWSRSPESLLGQKLVRNLRRELASQDRLDGALAMHRRVDHRQQRFQVFAWRSDSRHIVVEIEPLRQSDGRRLLSAVNAWLARLAAAPDETSLLNVLTRAVRNITGYDRAMVYEFDHAWHGVIVAEDRNARLPSLLGHIAPAHDLPPNARELLTRTPVRSIPDAQATAVALRSANDHPGPSLDLAAGALRAVSPLHLRHLQALGVGASLMVALRNEAGLWGMIACHAVQPAKLSPTVREAARTLVEMSSQRLFLLRARSDARFLERVQDSRALLSPTEGELRSPEQLVQEHGHHWLQLFRADGIALVAGDSITVLGLTPRQATLERATRWLQTERRGPAFWCGHARQYGPLAHAGDAGGCAGVLAAALTASPQSTAWLLMFRREVSYVQRWAGQREPKAPDPNDGAPAFQTWQMTVQGESPPWEPITWRAIRDLAEDLSIAAAAHEIQALNQNLDEERDRLARLNRRLEIQAHTDPLTGIWNRYRIEQVLDAEMAAGQRYGRPCSVLLLDIDHFKAINDQHGHDAGDQVLAALAARLRNALRPSDHFGRWGGEEFIVVLGQTPLHRARDVAERLRRELADTPVADAGTITVSIGAAEFRPDDSRRSLIDRADRALYAAKSSGRNRVRLATDLAS